MPRPYPVLFALPLLFVLPAWSVAQTLSQKDLDTRIDNQLFDILKLGTDIYNRGNPDACFRLYQGGLMGVVGFLEHRPDQIIKINKALKATDDITNVSERAFALRSAIDDLRAAIKLTYSTTKDKEPEKPSQPPTTQIPGRPSLWNRIGGELTITLVVEELVNRAMKNPRINLTRRGTGNQWEPNPENISKLKKQILHWISSASGGPFKYEGKDMKAAHLKLKITDDEFNAFEADLKSALEKYFVSPNEMTELLRLFQATKKDIVDTTTEVKTLWERLGGEPVVALIVDDFVDRAGKDAAVNFPRKGQGQVWAGTPDQITKLKKHLVQWVSSVSNGPFKYEGKSIKDAHLGMKITEAEFNAIVLDLKKSLAQFKINTVEQDELLKLVEQTRKEIVEVK